MVGRGRTCRGNIVRVLAPGPGLGWLMKSVKDTPAAVIVCRGEEARALDDAVGGTFVEQGPVEDGKHHYLV